MATTSVSATSANSRQGAYIGTLCGLAVALIWSSWSVATRYAVTSSLGPYDVTFLRFGVSALVLWPILLRNGLGLRQLGLGRLLVMVMGAGVPFMLLGSIGMQFAPASHVATLMIGTMPIWVALLSWLLFGDGFSRQQLGGIGVVITGVLCIGGYALIANRMAGEWRGDLLFLLAGLFFACFTVTQRRSGISPWHATALVNCLSALIFTPIYFLFLKPRIFVAPVGEVAFQIVAQGIAVAILGMFFYTEAVRRLGAPRAAIFGALAPALAVLIGAAFLKEVPEWLTLAGIGLVIGGVVLFVTGGRAKAAAEVPERK